MKWWHCISQTIVWQNCRWSAIVVIIVSLWRIETIIGAEVTEDDKKALAPYGDLYDDLLVGYDQLIRPVKRDKDKLEVKISLKLTQLIGVVSAKINKKKKREKGKKREKSFKLCVQCKNEQIHSPEIERERESAKQKQKRAETENCQKAKKRQQHNNNVSATTKNVSCSCPNCFFFCICFRHLRITITIHLCVRANLCASASTFK